MGPTKFRIRVCEQNLQKKQAAVVYGCHVGIPGCRMWYQGLGSRGLGFRDGLPRKARHHKDSECMRACVCVCYKRHSIQTGCEELQ